MSAQRKPGRRDCVLAMLREAGSKGVHTEVLARNGGGRNVSERRRELIALGYGIDSVVETWTGAGGEQCNGARYFLTSEPGPGLGAGTADERPREPLARASAESEQAASAEPETEAPSLFAVPEPESGSYRDPDSWEAA